jgi:hypothetical protein
LRNLPVPKHTTTTIKSTTQCQMLSSPNMEYLEWPQGCGW